jgi:hypothetical protein
MEKILTWELGQLVKLVVEFQGWLGEKLWAAQVSEVKQLVHWA